MSKNLKLDFFLSQFTILEDIKETEKTKISVVYHTEHKTTYFLRICKGRDLTTVCEALSKIRNTNTVVVCDFIYENGDTYILEENVDGRTIEEIIEVEGCFSEQDTARITIGVCNALEELHRLQPPVVHNDINPSNIKIREDGSVKLLDFDISRIYKKGQSQNTVLFGTEEYASPEHFGYGQSEPRTDIYCLGVTMHNMLTNKGLSNEHRITYNGKLKSIVKKCLEFDPKNRYPSVTDLKNDLNKFLTRKNVAIRNILILICVLPIICGTFFASKLFISNNTDSEISDSIINTTITGRADNVTDASAIIDTDDTNVTTSESADTPKLEPSAPINTAHSESDNTTAAEHSTEGTPPNDSRSTAWAITLNEKLSEEVLKDESNWYKFTTIAESSVYRIELFPETNQITNTLFPHLYFAVYDSVGIKIDEYYVWSVDTSNFIDLYLEPSTEYFIKVYLGSRFSTGEYSICVSEKLCDAGIDKDNASELILDTRYSASVNSTLSDWYVFNVKETGRYKITLHNIDVGCDIYISAKYSGTAGEGISVKNEDNYSWSINVQEGNPVYFEVYSYNKNPVANGNYIIEIEKVDS